MNKLAKGDSGRGRQRDGVGENTVLREAYYMDIYSERMSFRSRRTGLWIVMGRRVRDIRI